MDRWLGIHKDTRRANMRYVYHETEVSQGDVADADGPPPHPRHPGKSRTDVWLLFSPAAYRAHGLFGSVAVRFAVSAALDLRARLVPN